MHLKSRNFTNESHVVNQQTWFFLQSSLNINIKIRCANIKFSSNFWLVFNKFEWGREFYRDFQFLFSFVFVVKKYLYHRFCKFMHTYLLVQFDGLVDWSACLKIPIPFNKPVFIVQIMVIATKRMSLMRSFAPRPWLPPV